MSSKVTTPQDKALGTKKLISILPLSQTQRKWLITISLLLGDGLALVIAFWAAYLARFELLPYHSTYDLREYCLLVAGVVPLWILVFAVSGLYSTRILFGGLQEYARVFNGVTIGIMIVIAVGFLRRDDITISRGWLAISWLLALVLVWGFRFTYRRVVYSFRRRGHLLSPALIVGTNDEGLALAEQLQNRASSGLYILGFISNDVHSTNGQVYQSFEALGCLDDLESVINESDVDEVIVAPTALSREELLGVFRTLSTYPEINLRLSSGLFEIMTTSLRVQELAYVPLIEVSKNRISGVDASVKWLLDYGLAIPALILASPLLLIIALAIRRDSSGPVIHRRRVLGVGGDTFDAFKFRTMYTNGDEILADHPGLHEELVRNHKIRNDPRVTTIGRFLRKFSLDELPQLFNVLLGQMSLVGPRMISPPEMEHYGKWGMNLLTVKPGITGLWQISGRSDISYPGRVRMDMQYIRNWTIWQDIYILVATIPAVIKKKGAF